MLTCPCGLCSTVRCLGVVALAPWVYIVSAGLLGLTILLMLREAVLPPPFRQDLHHARHGRSDPARR